MLWIKSSLLYLRVHCFTISKFLIDVMTLYSDCVSMILEAWKRLYLAIARFLTLNVMENSLSSK